MKNENQLSTVKTGRKVQFEQCFVANYPVLLRKAYQLLKVPYLAEDAVQDVFVQLWQSDKELSSLDSTKAYLFTCVKNRCLNILRSRKREILRYIEHGQQKPTVGKETEETVIFNEISEKVKEKMASLSPSRKEVFEMKLSGVSNKEIAEHFNISENTVKVHFNRASKLVRRTIGT